MYRKGLPPIGMMLSLCSSLPRSAIGWSSPIGPTRFGPRRTWNRPISRRSTHVSTANVSITRFTSTSDLMAVTMNPSGIGRRLRLRRGDAARADGGARCRQADDAGAQPPVDQRRAGRRAALPGRPHAVACGDAKPLGVIVRELDRAAALELQLLGVIDLDAGHQLAVADHDDAV